MSRYKAYPAYKPTYSKWVLDIPSHWLSITFKRVVLSIKDGTHGTYERKADGFPLLSAKNIQNYGIELSESESMISVEDHHEITKNGFPSKGDLLITCVGTIGRSCIYEFDEVLSFQRSVAFLRLSKAVVPKFYKWFVESKPYQSQLEAQSKASAQSGVYMGDLVNTTTVFPSFIEQEKIVAFLDHETAKIDALIQKQQRLIELLKEKRQAVISHAVTKGINPNAPMKDSGVEWLGEVPQHWRVGALGYNALISSGATPDRSNPTYWNGSIPWIKTGEVKYEEIFEAEEYISEDALCNSSVKLSPPGTLLMAMYGQGVTRGRVAILGVPATYNQACAAITPSAELFNQYLLFFLMAAYHAIRDGGNETSQMNLNAEIVGKFKVTIPSLTEQNEIVTHLKPMLVKFDSMISRAESAILLMQERRTALISAAVTGKIDVRDWQPAAAQAVVGVAC